MLSKSKSQKMSSRTGNVIPAMDLLDSIKLDVTLKLAEVKAKDPQLWMDIDTLPFEVKVELAKRLNKRIEKERNNVK